MLILTRRIGESIQIGEDITICVLEIRGNQVRLGVDAPANVLVLRSELVDRQKTTTRPRSDAPQH